MSGYSFWRIDGKSMPWTIFREAAGRFLLLLLTSGFFIAMLLSGGVNRYLSDRWAITAVLRNSVTVAEGKEIAKKASGLPGVRSAEYKDPETSWKEFLEAYPGLETLRTAGASPLPGYVSVRMRPDRFIEGEIGAVEAALKPLPEVEKLISGAESLPAVLNAGRWVNSLLIAGFAVLCAVVFAIFYFQEKSRAALLSGDFDFLAERGVPPLRIALSRAAGAVLLCAFLSVAAAASSASVFFLLEDRFPAIRHVIGPAGEIITVPVLIPLALFLFAAAILSGGASLLGWRAARSRRK